MAHDVQRGLQGDEKWLQELEAVNKHDWGYTSQTGKADGVWRSSVDFTNDSKLAVHEKEHNLEDYNCMEDYHNLEIITEDLGIQ